MIETSISESPTKLQRMKWNQVTFKENKGESFVKIHVGMGFNPQKNRLEVVIPKSQILIVKKCQ